MVTLDETFLLNKNSSDRQSPKTQIFLKHFLRPNMNIVLGNASDPLRDLTALSIQNEHSPHSDVCLGRYILSLEGAVSSPSSPSFKVETVLKSRNGHNTLPQECTLNAGPSVACPSWLYGEVWTLFQNVLFAL
jgi:hypothetical protein